MIHAVFCRIRAGIILCDVVWYGMEWYNHQIHKWSCAIIFVVPVVAGEENNDRGMRMPYGRIYNHRFLVKIDIKPLEKTSNTWSQLFLIN